MSHGLQACQGRILLVDDDPFYRELASTALIEAGFSVVCAADGQAAVSEVEAAAFDLVVLDLALPGLSGFDVISRIRDALKKPDLPILVITGHDDTGSVERAFDLGVKSFLAKPLNWPLFVHHVNFVLKSARAQASLRDATRTAGFMSDLQTRLVNILVTEFQAPLRQAYGFSTLLKREADGPIDSPLYASWIADLHQALDRLNVTHAKMLNFGRSLAEGITLNEDVFDLRETLATAIAASQDLMQRRHVALVHSIDLHPTARFRGDRVMLEQVMRHLVDNAARFSRRNSDIRIAVETTPDGSICLAITDTSPPLSQAQIADVLGRAPTLQKTSSQNVEFVTTLKMCRVLVEAHQGQLRMHAVGGEGTRTEVVLPRSRTTQSATVRQLQPAPAMRQVMPLDDASRDVRNTPASRVQLAR